MGIENNEAIIATTWNKEVAEKTREWIRELPRHGNSFLRLFQALSTINKRLYLRPMAVKRDGI